MTITAAEVTNLGLARCERVVRALRQRGKIDKAIADLEARRGRVDEAIEGILSEASERRPAPTPTPRKTSRRIRRAGSTTRKAAIGATKMTAGKARKPAKLLSHFMQDVFEKHGKPLRVGELVDRVFAAGYRTEAKDPRRSTYNGILLAVKANPEVFRKAGPGMVKLVTQEPAKAR